jgi:hypothetical protein
MLTIVGVLSVAIRASLGLPLVLCAVLAVVCVFSIAALGRWVGTYADQLCEFEHC